VLISLVRFPSSSSTSSSSSGFGFLGMVRGLSATYIIRYVFIISAIRQCGKVTVPCEEVTQPCCKVTWPHCLITEIIQYLTSIQVTLFHRSATLTTRYVRRQKQSK
jgi:hypothetical protein